MDIFLKILSGVLVALILYLIVSKQNKDVSLLLTISVCCMVTVASFEYLEPIFTFINKLQSLGQLNGDLLEILLKSVGIGLLSEVTSLLCSDAGNGAMAKTLQFLASGVILWLSLPLFTRLIELVEEILVAL